MSGLTGKTVLVDLGSGEVSEFETDEKLLFAYIGGRGLGVKLLCEFADPKADPLSPENPLIFTIGPLTGLASLGGRYVVTARSPLTGTVFSWNAGGNFGKELRFAGIGALIIKGKAKTPVYLRITEGKIKIEPAEGLWGKNTKECTEILSPLGSVVCIGRAGEREVAISSLVSDLGHLSRGGLGALAGSKRLKAVVVKGHLNPKAKDHEAFLNLETKVQKLLDANPVLSKGLANYGTPVFVTLLNYLQLLPSRNFLLQKAKAAENLSGEYIKTGFELEKESCYLCPLGCRHRIKESGALVPEYDALWAFGLNLENPDLASVLRANGACLEYGLDPVSAGSVLGAYAELAGKTLTPSEIEVLLKEVGEGESELGEGALRYLTLKGAKNLSMTVKGLELAGFDPRGVLGQALAYASSNRGGDYLSAFMIGPEVLGKPLILDRLSLKGKAGTLQVFENLTALLDSLVLCPYSVLVLNEEMGAALLRTATGKPFSAAALLKTGERIWNLERLFNQKAGFTRADDTLPERFFEKEELGGISKEEFETALLEYYHFRGWDKSGRPTEGKIKELGIWPNNCA